MHVFDLIGAGENVTGSPADHELPHRTVEKQSVAGGSEEEILEPDTSLAEISGLVERSWGVEETMSEQATTMVKGRLREHVEFWKEVIKAPAYIIDCIQ